MEKTGRKSIRNVQVIVELPEEISKEKIYAFGHGPLTGNVEILNGREIKYTLENYYPWGIFRNKYFISERAGFRDK